MALFLFESKNPSTKQKLITPSIESFISLGQIIYIPSAATLFMIKWKILKFFTHIFAGFLSHNHWTDEIKM